MIFVCICIPFLQLYPALHYVSYVSVIWILLLNGFLTFSHMMYIQNISRNMR